MRQKLQNSKGHVESPEFVPVLGLFRSLSLQPEVNSIHISLDYKKNCTHIYIFFMDTKLITLPCALMRIHNKFSSVSCETSLSVFFKK